MERLTKITEIGNAYFPKCFEEPCCGMGKCIDNNCNLVNEVCKKLAEYETLEEQGLLVRLPCKVGDTMYDIIGKPLRIVEHKVDAFHIDKKGFHLQIINGVLEKKQEAKVYFSREEAKKKLEEMKKND